MSADEHRNQIDLVNRLNCADTKIDEEPDFIAFVHAEKIGDGNDVQNEEVRALIAKLNPEDLEDLRRRFRSTMESVLEAMWELRAKAVPDEAAIERCLVPDDVDMNKIMRYAAHLTRLEEKAIVMLEKLQTARRQKRDGGR